MPEPQILSNTHPELPIITPIPLRVLIVDDEDLARRSIRLLLQGDSDITDILEAPNGRAALEFFQSQNEKNRVDVLFLDIQMPEMTGFEVLQALEGKQIPVTIFVTAFDRYALRAFEASAVDYVLKPFEDERFAQALSRAKQRCREQKIYSANGDLMRFLDDNPLYASSYASLQRVSSPHYLQRLTLQSRQRTIVVDVGDIDWIEAESYYVQIHTSSKSYLMRETMTNLEMHLNPQHFQRIHRSAMVNLRAVREVESHTHGDGTVILRDGTRLKLARSRKQQFMEAL